MVSCYQVSLRSSLPVFDFWFCQVGRDGQTIFGLVTRRLRDETLGGYNTVRPA